MAMRMLCLLLCGFTAITHAANDAELQSTLAIKGTVSVTSDSITAQGDPVSCGFSFTALHVDDIYKSGAPIKVAGSFAIRRMKKQLFLLYKIGVFDMVGLKLTPAPPFFVWMRFGKVLIKATNKANSDSPGYILFTAPLPEDPKPLLDALAQQHEVTLGFNRRNGGADVVLNLDMSVRNTYFETTGVRPESDPSLGPAVIKCLDDLTTFADSLP